MARPTFYCVLLLLVVQAAWSLVPQAAMHSSRQASRAAHPKGQLGGTDPDESNAEMAARIVGKYVLYGRVSNQDQTRWLKLNAIEAKRQASCIQASGAVMAGAVMVLPQMDPTAVGKALEEMARHSPETLCVLLDNKLCVYGGAGVGVAALYTCVNAAAAEELWNLTAANLVILDTDKFPTKELARIGKKFAKTGRITDQEQNFLLEVKDADATREVGRNVGGGAFVCSVIVKMGMSSTPAVLAKEMAHDSVEALVPHFLEDLLTRENALCVLGIAALSSVGVYAINVVSQKGEDTEKIKVLFRGGLVPSDLGVRTTTRARRLCVYGTI
jgi:hypothetical protein